MRPSGGWRALLLVLALLLASAGPALAAPSATEDFAAGKNAFQYGDYKSAIRILASLLYPTPQLTDEVRLVEGYKLLGIAYFFEGQRDRAQREFAALLTLKPDHKLDPVIYPPPVVVFFETVRQGMAPELERLREQERRREEARKKADDQRRRDEEERRRIYIDRRVIEVRRPFFPALLPFGAGQFNNGHTVKGVIFLSVEAALVATSIALYATAESYRLPSSRIRDTDQRTVLALQIAQVTTAGLAVGVMGAGILEAVLSYRRLAASRTEERVLPRNDPAATPDPARPVKQPSKVNVSPFASPSGGGLLLMGRF